MLLNHDRKIALGLGIAAMVLGSGMAHAATNQELEQRIDRLEQMLNQTRADLKDQERENQKVRQQATKQVRSGKQSKAREAPPAGGFRIGDHTTVDIGGYVKFDAIYSDFSDGVPGDDAREFYFPNRVPVAPTTAAQDGGQATDFHANQTRINLTTITKLGGHKIKGFVETDFFGGGGNEVVTNSTNPRLRHAFIEIDDTWLFGQTWSNFMDLKAYPETLDFIGPAESVPFIRQAQIRYTHGNFAVSLENPETTFDNFGPEVEEDYPELVGSYNLPTNFGHLGLGAVVRQVTDQAATGTPTIDTDGDGIPDSPPANPGDDSAVGYGVRLSGTVGLGKIMGNPDFKDEIRFLGFYGDGLGRYIGVGSASAAYVRNDGNVETIPYYGGYIDFKHHWSEQWRSNLVLGTQQIENDDQQGGLVNEEANSIHVNLLWNPLDPLTLGGEYLYADRELENGASGNLNRFQMSAKYAF